MLLPPEEHQFPYIITNDAKLLSQPQPPERSSQMASTLQLEFAQAMSDFKTMFPDMERDVIEAVLRANQGAVDATIDQLLAMSVDNQASISAHAFIFGVT